MNLTNILSILVALISLSLIYLSWELKNFQFLLLSGSFFLTAFAIKFKNLREYSVPMVSTLIALTIAEYLTLLALPNAQNLLLMDSGYYERVPGLGYRPKPGQYTAIKTNSNGDKIYEAVYTIGEDGYRADFISENYDAFLYGGSFAFGEGLNDDETISYFLKHNHGISAKNVGIHGYGLHQALYNIQTGVTSKKENSINILLTAPWHALRSACKPSYSGGTPRFVIDNVSLKKEGVCPGGGLFIRVLSRSNIVKLLKLAFAQKNNILSNSDIELYLEIIKEIKSLSEENKAKLIIGYIDAHDNDLSNTIWTNDSLIEELKRIADSVVDLSLAPKREELDAKFYLSEFDQHPSALANRRRAEILSTIFN